MQTHRLKIYPPYFAAICDGSKTWELRKNDRNYQVGDELYLDEYKPASPETISEKNEPGRYTGSFAQVKVKYILENPPGGLESGYCLMSIEMIYCHRMAYQPEPIEAPDAFPLEVGIEIAHKLEKSINRPGNKESYTLVDSHLGFQMVNDRTKESLPFLEWITGILCK